MLRQFYVYILANVRASRLVLYVGMTNNLYRRMAEHRSLTGGFTARYRVTTLVYAETMQDAISALAREKQIKGWTRAKKIALVTASNPNWCDLLRGEQNARVDPSAAPQDDKVLDSG